MIIRAGSIAVAVCLTLLPSALTAQQAAVTGRVVHAQTLQPLAGAQVTIDGRDIGTLSQANGIFRMENVPTGPQTVTVQRIGFQRTSQQVTVQAGQTAVVNFSLQEQALSLDEVIVTGTPGGTQRRAIGNSVARVDVGASMQEAPAISLQGALQGRAPGVTILPSSGSVGSGGSIRIRGNSSFTLSNEPIVYIDGVRMDARSSRGNIGVNPLNDIDPSTIESVEVIKGPAAATLYGTEASGGVIQIITKRGSVGSPVFEVSSEMGTHWLPDPAGTAGTSYWRNPADRQMHSFNLYEYEIENGLGPAFQNGVLQNIGASVRGGNDLGRYYASLGWEDNTGVIANDYQWQKLLNGRLNLNTNLHETVSADFSLGVVRNTRTEQGASTENVFSSLIWAQPRHLVQPLPSRGWHAAPPEAYAIIEDLSQVDRTTGSIQVTHRPFSWLTQRLTAGSDIRTDNWHKLFPRQPDGGARFHGTRANGVKEVNVSQTQLSTLDWGATARMDVTSALTAETAVGFQYYQRKVYNRGSIGSIFPAPVITTISGAATTSGSENYLENVTVGVFVQEQFGWNNRIFITGAVRMDDNSAFGENFNAAVYPKLSGTWVLSEEPFWNLPLVNQFRLRSAFGTSGKQPDVFAAQRFYDPVTGPSGQPGLTPGTIGNPDLKPERGEELEVGFDMGLLDDRVSAAFTFYNRYTRDAILNRDLPTSEGFPGSQSVNAGLVRAWGTELQLDALLIQRERFGLDGGVTFATMRNRIEDMGGIPASGAGARRHMEGYSLADLWWWEVVSAEYNAAGSVTNARCRAAQDRLEEIVPCSQAQRVHYGPTYPTWELGINNGVTIGSNLRLAARVYAQGGHWGVNHDHLASAVSFNNTWHVNNPRQYPIYDAYRSLVGRDPIGFFKRDFAKLRDVSATYTVPQSLANRVGASRASIGVSGSNLWTFWFPGKWTTLRNMDEPLRGPDNPKGGPERTWDPEMEPAGEVFAGNILSMMPPTRRFLTSIRLTF